MSQPIFVCAILVQSSIMPIAESQSQLPRLLGARLHSPQLRAQSWAIAMARRCAGPGERVAESRVARVALVRGGMPAAVAVHGQAAEAFRCEIRLA